MYVPIGGHQSVCPTDRPSDRPSVRPPVCPYVRANVRSYVCPSVSLSLTNWFRQKYLPYKLRVIDLFHQQRGPNEQNAEHLEAAEEDAGARRRSKSGIEFVESQAQLDGRMVRRMVGLQNGGRRRCGRG